MTNPYEPPKTLDSERGQFGDFSRLRKKSFLYREIELMNPFPAVLVYNGWNFLQRITISDVVVWKRISWVVIHRNASFNVPSSIVPNSTDPGTLRGEMQIVFSRGLLIKRFSITLGSVLVYDEWN